MSRSLLYVVLDSLSCGGAHRAIQLAEELPQHKDHPLHRMGPPALRHSYATWTYPSHAALAQGLTPYLPSTRPAWEVYRDTLSQWGRWLDRDIPVDGLAPYLSLPRWLGAHGVRCGLVASLPCIGPATALNRDWVAHVQAHRHDDLRAAAGCCRWDGDWCWIVNTGETHYPYSTRGVQRWAAPRVPGLHGVAAGRTSAGDPDPRSVPLMQALRQYQAEAALDALEALRDAARALPPETWVVVTADHGELFGEHGCYGHGPYPYRELLEVPWWEFPASLLTGGC